MRITVGMYVGNFWDHKIVGGGVVEIIHHSTRGMRVLTFQFIAAQWQSTAGIVDSWRWAGKDTAGTEAPEGTEGHWDICLGRIRDRVKYRSKILRAAEQSRSATYPQPPDVALQVNTLLPPRVWFNLPQLPQVLLVYCSSQTITLHHGYRSAVCNSRSRKA